MLAHSSATMRHRALMLSAVSLVMLLAASPGSAAPEALPEAAQVGVATAPMMRPSASQLKRLYHLEPYIRYFTSLAYGPDNARISADYIRALILTESAGDKWAKSHKGARGLTQIIPSTARAVASKLDRSGYDYLYVDEAVFEHLAGEDLYDPALNILIACYLSATYHLRFDGRTDLVASAWNAGPGAVARYGNEPPPYPETRQMISRVQGYLHYLEKVAIH